MEVNVNTIIMDANATTSMGVNENTSVDEAIENTSVDEAIGNTSVDEANGNTSVDEANANTSVDEANANTSIRTMNENVEEDNRNENRIEVMEKKMETIMMKLSVQLGNIQTSIFENMSNFPLTSIEAIKNLDEQIEGDAEARNIFIQFLVRLGNLKEIIFSIYDSALSNKIYYKNQKGSNTKENMTNYLQTKIIKNVMKTIDVQLTDATFGKNYNLILTSERKRVNKK